MKPSICVLKWSILSLFAILILFSSCKKDDDNNTTVQRTKLSEWSGTFTGNTDNGTLSFALYSGNYISLSWQTPTSSCTNSNGSYTLNGSNFTLTVSGTASSNKESSTFSMSGQGTLNSGTGDGSYSIDFDNPNFTDQSGQWTATTGGSQFATVTMNVSLPTDAEGRTGVIIFDDDTDPGNGFVKGYEETLGPGTYFSFDLDDIPTGTYYLIAVVYIVNSYGDEPGPGDYIGIYGTTFPNMPTQANAYVPASGTKTFNIDLVVWTKD